MQRLTPGPFNGFLDELDYESPAFVPVLLTCALLLFVWVATAWALWRRHPPRARQAVRGFTVKLPDGGNADV